MKNLVFIIALFLIATASSSQNSNQNEYENQVITTDGKVFNGDIDSYLAKKINFLRSKDGLDDNSIPIEMVKKIIGPMPDRRIRRILKDNPNVEFGTAFADKPQSVPPSQQRINASILQKTPGDLIKTSATLRLTGYAIGIGTSTLALANVFDDPETSNTVSIVGGLVSFGLFIAAEVTLIHAGDLMNRERVTLSPASEGIGMAINF